MPAPGSPSSAPPYSPTPTRSPRLSGPAATAAQVAAHLDLAKAEFDAAGTDLDARNLVASANHFGTGVNELNEAAKAAGVELRPVLLREIGWTNASPQGLARQLGLPAIPPSIGIRDGVVEYAVDAPGQAAAAVPVLGFDRLAVTAWLRIDGQAAHVRGLRGDRRCRDRRRRGPDRLAARRCGRLGAVRRRPRLRHRPRAHPVGQRGPAGRAARAHEDRTARHPRARDRAAPGAPDTFDIGSTFTVDLGGVITATVDGAGVHVHIDPRPRSAGNNPLAVAVKAPTGIGLGVDAGLVRGGGFLGVRSGGYGGALQLRLGPVEVKAVGLLTLEPGFALVVVMSVEFTPAIDLTFGFTLNAVGGMLGIEHRMDTDALRAGIADGALDHILFPEDPVAAAPTILDTLETVFPVDQGSIVIGPMVEIGWGRPVCFLTAQLGVIISLPDPKIVIIGRVRIALPAPELPIVDLRATVYGEITADHLLILVSLRGSRIAGFTVTGDIGLLLRWSGGAEFAISAGGFHPRYQPPKELTGHAAAADGPVAAGDPDPARGGLLRADVNSVQLGCAGRDGRRPRRGVDHRPLRVRRAGGLLAALHVHDRSRHRAHRARPGRHAVRGHHPAAPRGPGAVAGRGQRRGRDPVVDDRRSTSARSPGATTTTRRRCPLTRASWCRRRSHRNPGAWQALTPPDADQVVRLAAAHAERHRRDRAPARAVRRAPARGAAGDRDRPGRREPRARRASGGSTSACPPPTTSPRPARSARSPTCSRPATSSTSPTTRSCRGRASSRCRPGPGCARPARRPRCAAARQVELRYETFVGDDDSLPGLRLRAASLDAVHAFGGRRPRRRCCRPQPSCGPGRRYATAPDPIVLGDPGEASSGRQVDAGRRRRATMTYTHAAEIQLGRRPAGPRLGVG